jgi:protoheme IX farnesyltransferase
LKQFHGKSLQRDSSDDERTVLTPVSPQLAGLRRVGIASTAFAFALVVWGAIVRINGAGMTCPDWPRCRGVWFPALDPKVVYEFYHRVGAIALTVIVVATFIAAWRARADAPAALRAAWFALGLIVVQIIAGALTIILKNNPPSVAIHLVLGFSTFISLLIVTLASYAAVAQEGSREMADDNRRQPAGRGFAWLALTSTVLAFAAVFAAGYMSASNDGIACIGFPLCNGLGPALTSGQQIHMAHRFSAYATIVAVFFTWIAALRGRWASPAIITAAWMSLGLALLQGVLGVLAVVTRLAPVLRSWHEANAALLVGSLVALTYLAFRSAAEVDRGPAAASDDHRPNPASAVTTTIANYFGLIKLNVMSLLLFTTLASMMMAAGGLPSWRLIFWTMLGGALASASSAAINMYFDRDIDAVMKRTQKRPIPSGRVSPRRALGFGIALGLLAFVQLSLTVNLLAASLSAAGILYYVFVYTIWLKRTTPQNIVIGGAAGSIPPLVGWAAVTGHIGLTALLLFLIVFVWTPPHFWALALLKKEEYTKVGIPMMPAVYGDAATKRQILAYTLALAAITLIMVPMHLMGAVYLACAVALDAVFLAFAIWVARTGSKKSEGLMYRFSMVYLALLFAAMVIDRYGHGPAAS